MTERDTPRTDERETRSQGLNDEYCFSFCRKLEREVNELRQVLQEVQPLLKTWGPFNHDYFLTYIDAAEKLIRY